MNSLHYKTLYIASTIPKFQRLDEKKVSDLFVNPNSFQELYPGETTKHPGVRLQHTNLKDSPIYIAMHDKEKESKFFQAFAVQCATTTVKNKGEGFLMVIFLHKFVI